MKVFKKVFNTIINILIVLVLVVSILVATLALTSESSGISHIFGYTVQPVMSPSMEGGSEEFDGGDIDEGDVIIGNITDPDAVETYKVGDIVTYSGILKGYEDMGEQFICHRIVDVIERDGELYYQTQGDNRKVSQVPDQENEDLYITERDIVAVYYTDDYEGFSIPFIGSVYSYISTQEGFFVCILLPMILFFLYVLIRVIINFVEYKKSKEDENKKQISNEDYEKFQEYLAQQEKEKSSDENSDSEVQPEQSEEKSDDEAKAKSEDANAETE